MKVFIMGQGNVLTSFGTYQGYPCICFGDAKVPGPVGGIADGQKDHLTENGVTLVFATEEAATRVMDMVMGSVLRAHDEAIEKEEAV